MSPYPHHLCATVNSARRDPKRPACGSVGPWTERRWPPVLSLDNMVWILQREVAALRKDLQSHAYTETARRHKQDLVRLLEAAIGNLETYIRESQRPYVPVLDVAGHEAHGSQAGTL